MSRVSQTETLESQLLSDLFKASPIVAAIIESSGDAIASATLDGTIVSWNEGAQRIYEYTEAEAVGKPITMLVPPELPNEENKIIETVKAGGRIEQLETVRVTKTGKRINVSLSISPIKDKSGKTVGCAGIARDITERKSHEMVLRTGEERLPLAQQAARIGTFELNVKTGVNTWNSELEALYGLPPGGFGRTQTHFENLLHHEDRAGLVRLIQESFRTRQSTKAEWRIVWPDGSVHWIGGWWQVFVDESGEPARMVGVNVDITERKLIEQRLREYEQAVEASGEMITVIDREYRVLVANREYLKKRNLTRDQVVGRFAYELVTEKAFKDVFKPKLDECFQGNVVKFELQYTYPELGERDLAISYFPIEGVNGVDRVACLLLDITDRKTAEQALAEMTRKLIDAQEQERSRIGRELHDDISQQLVMLAVELDQLEEHPCESQTRVQELRKRVAEISSDVRALSHDLHSSKLEYLGIVAGIKTWCKEFAERQKVGIDFSSGVQRILPVEVGLTLFRVLQEALHNAVKHSGVKRLEVQLHEGVGEIHLIVRDSGRGFDVEAVKQRKGLGLTSMRERVRLVNGTIKIQSEPLAGTTIHVRIPM